MKTLELKIETLRLKMCTPAFEDLSRALWDMFEIDVDKAEVLTLSKEDIEGIVKNLEYVATTEGIGYRFNTVENWRYSWLIWIIKGSAFYNKFIEEETNWKEVFFNQIFEKKGKEKQ